MGILKNNEEGSLRCHATPVQAEQMGLRPENHDDANTHVAGALYIAAALCSAAGLQRVAD